MAFSVGIHIAEFRHLTPKKLGYCLKGLRIEQKRKDEEMWRMGLYVQSAVSTAVEHNLAGKKAKSKYIEKPILYENKEENTNRYKESNEEIAIFEMKQRINLLRQQGLPESPM